MRLRIRLFLFIVKSIFIRKDKWQRDSLLHFCVLPSDCVVRYMGNDRYHAFMDCGRIDLLIRLVGWKVIIRKNLRPFVYTSHIMYRKPLEIFTPFRLRTRIIHRDNYYFWIEHAFEQNGQVMAMAITKNGLCNYKKMMATKTIAGFCRIDFSGSPENPVQETAINDTERFLRRIHW